MSLYGKIITAFALILLTEKAYSVPLVDSYCAAAYLKVFLDTERTPGGRTNGWDRFAFHDEPFRSAQAVLNDAKPMNQYKALSVFNDLKDVGGEYEVSFSVSDKTQNVSANTVFGTVTRVEIGAVDKRTYVVISGSHGTFSGSVLLDNIDPRSIKLREEPVPGWAIEENRLSEVARKSGIVWFPYA